MSPDLTQVRIMTPMLDGRDGVSEVSRQAIRALVAQMTPADVETWTLSGERPSESDGIPVHAFRTAHGHRNRMVTWTVRRAVQSVRGLTVVVMHLHLAPLAAVLAARGARMVVFVHGVEAWHRLRPRDRLALTAADRIIANSHRTAELFHSANVEFGDVAVCPLGVSPATASTIPSAETGFALIVGRMAAAERYKGHDALIDAWPWVLEAVPHARLIVAGDGDDRTRLANRVAEKNLTHAITFVGRVPDAELQGLFQACAAFVMPSRGEGFGLVYLEAMRAGKPCIALRAAGEIIDGGVTGLLLDDTEPQTLAAAVTRLLSDDALCRRLGVAAAAKVCDYYEERHFARRFTDAVGVVRSPGTTIAAHTMSIGA
jgi:phosphatidyl-myo-inositol dimannoside synthase